MKDFLKARSYDMVKMFLNQFASAVFGFALVLASGVAQSVTMRNITSVCSILFYLFLLYTMTWDLGFLDKVSVESGRKKRNIFTGALISLCANSINFLFAILIMLGNLLPETVFGNIGGVSGAAALLLEGMYTGLLANHVFGAALNSYWFIYFLLPIPAILVCFAAYNLGLHDVKFTSLFRTPYPESDHDPKKKK